MNIPFQPDPGLIVDDTKFASVGSWRDASMVRFFRGQWQIMGGWEKLTLDVLGGVCRAVFGWTDGTTFNVAFGTHQTLELWQGGAKYDITPAAGFTPGAIDGTGGAGYGTGAFDVGEYGEPSTADAFPLTWSLGAFGSWLIANPRNQGIFAWQNNTATPAAALANAPVNVAYTLSVPQRQIMALGCNEEVSGTFNPLCIRWSDIEAPTVWNTASDNNAGEYILAGGGRIVCGRVVGDYVLVWTDVALYLGTFIGAPDETWRFQKVGDHCGAISPGAPVVRGQEATWISPDHNFWSYGLGGAPQIIDCPIRLDFAENVSLGQGDKIVGASVSTFGEVCWFYPDARDGLEVSRDLRVSSQGWTRGRLARTAFMDAGPATYPVGVSSDPVAGTGAAYWHEKGHTADGGPLAGWIESNDFYLNAAQAGVMVDGCWPDFADQLGALQLTIFMRERPQALERVKGPWTLAPGKSQRSFRASGRIARVRFDFNSAPAFARGGQVMFDVSPIGGR